MTTFRIPRKGLILLALGTSVSGAALAQSDDRRFYVAPMATYTLADDDRINDNAYGGSIAIGKRFTNYLDLEIYGLFSQYPNDGAGKDMKLYGAGGGANLYPLPNSKLFGNAYIRLAVTRGQGKDAQGPIADYTTTLFDAGLGYNLTLTSNPLGPFAPGIALRLEALYRHDAHGRDQLGAQSPDQYFQDIVFGLGLRIPLGGRPGPAIEAPVEPIAVVPVEEPPVAEEPPPPPPPPCEPPVPGQPINLDGCKEGDTLVLRGVNFEFDKSRLTVNAKALLDPVADALVARPDIKVEIDGHTDSKGSDAYNQKLSEARAASVVTYLTERGVDAGRMTSMGFGESQPVADNATEEGRELNRRVELKITEAGAGGVSAESPAPADDAVVEEAVTEAAVVEETATEETVVEETVTEETVVEEAPMEEAPAEEAPMEEAPAEEAPMEDAPAEEAPIDEAPVEG